MKIAVDAMGGDYAPGVVIEAVATALKELPEVEIILVGNLPKLQYHLAKAKLKESSRLSFVHAEEVVEMGEPSTNAVRTKRHSSITVCAELVKAGKAAAIVSAGHTGAAVAATKVRLRMVPGVERPAIATLLPAIGGKFIMVDAGANTDCDPLNLAQFAVMGEIYSKLFLGVENPRVGLLSVGGEDVILNGIISQFHDVQQRSEMQITYIIKTPISVCTANMNQSKYGWFQNRLAMHNISRIIIAINGVNQPSLICGSPTTNTIGSCDSNGFPLTVAFCQAATNSLGTSNCFSPYKGTSVSLPAIKQTQNRIQRAS